ncbi:MAG: N-acetyltransferase [Aeromicrobium sp.]|nr:N-acetyltransferase [Aeromicrobium sp.]
MPVRMVEPGELEVVVGIHRRAFGSDVEANLARALMHDPAYLPELSLAGERAGRLLGHVVFTRMWLVPDERGPEVPLALLAPLAVVPEAQRTGVGTAVVQAAIRRARELGEIAMLVLGHPEYYPRFGFEPALPRGIRAPYPIEPAEAWMVLPLSPAAEELPSGVVRVADPIAGPDMWRE